MNLRVYVLYSKRLGSPPEARFAFHASSLKSAESMASSWAQHHDFKPSDFGAEEYPNYRESGVVVRDDWVFRDFHKQRSVQLLEIYSLSSRNDDHPMLSECHLVQGAITPQKVRDLLTEVAAFYADGQFAVLDGVIGTRLSPSYGLAAVTGNGMIFISCKA